MTRFKLILALGFIVAAALLSAKAPDPNAIVAKVGDRSYSYKKFNDGLKAYMKYHKTAQAYTSQDSIRLNNQYWEELVGMYIYDQAIKEGKVKVTNTELEAEVIRNPPEGARDIPDFKTNGKFDKKKFEAALKSNPTFKNEVLDYARSMYSYNKLINAIKNEVSADPDSVAREWNKAHDTASATIIHFDYTKLTNITVTDEETQLYYNEHKEEYKKGPGRGYLFARFAGALSKSEDKGEIARENKIKAAALYSRAQEIGLVKAAAEMNIPLEQSGLFAESDDIIPLIGRAQELKAFAFSNPVGKMPQVFYPLTGDVFVLEIDRAVDEFYPDYEQKKGEINITATRTKRMYAMNQYVQDFIKNNQPENYLEIAAKDSLAIVEANDLTIDSEIKPLGRIPALNKAILDNTVGNFTPVIEKDRHWYLAKTNTRSFPNPEEWTSVKTKVLQEADAKLKQEHLNKWYLERRGKTDITDNRHEYYNILTQIKL